MNERAKCSRVYISTSWCKQKNKMVMACATSAGSTTLALVVVNQIGGG